LAAVLACVAMVCPQVSAEDSRKGDKGGPPLTVSRLERINKDAAEFLLARQKDTVRLYRFSADGKAIAEAVDVAAEWKDVTIGKGTDTVTIAGKEYRGVGAVRPPGWCESEPGVGGDPDDIGRATSMAVLGAHWHDNALRNGRYRRSADSCLNVHVAESAKPGDPPTLRPGLRGLTAEVLRMSALVGVLSDFRHGETNALARRNHELAYRRLAAGRLADGGWSASAGRPGTGTGPGGAKAVSETLTTSLAVLGLRGACPFRRTDLDVPEKVWADAARLLTERQAADGSFAERPGEAVDAGSEQALVTAATATLALLTILHEHHVAGRVDKRNLEKADPPPLDADPATARTLKAIDAGLGFLGKHFRPTADGRMHFLCGRIGALCGTRRFGPHDWFRECAEDLVRRAADDGGFDIPPGPDRAEAAAWRATFATIGWCGLLVTKLRHGPAGSPAWNHLPSDLMRLSGWWGRGRSLYSDHSWQVVGLPPRPDADPEAESDLLDTPLVYISSPGPLAFTDGEVAVLRRYVERGGTLLFAPTSPAGAERFTASAVEIGRRLYPPDRFPERQFTAATPEHPLYRDLKPTAPVIRRVPLLHASNGYRSFAFVLPPAAPLAWQANRYIASKEMFSVYLYITAYATDRACFASHRLRRAEAEFAERLTPPAPAVAGKPYRVAVVRYTSDGTVKLQAEPGKAGTEREVKVLADWDSVPAAWPAFAKWFRRATGREVAETRGVSLTDPGLKSFDLLHLQGHHAFTLTDAERKALADYVAAGGTVLVDPVGMTKAAGEAFLKSAERELAAALPGRTFVRPAEDSPLLTGAIAPGVKGTDIVEAGVTSEVLLKGPGTTQTSQLLRVIAVDGRPAVVLADADVSVAMAGQRSAERYGLKTPSARGLVGNLLLTVRR
jgi:hypothetical protein